MKQFNLPSISKPIKSRSFPQLEKSGKRKQLESLYQLKGILRSHTETGIVDPGLQVAEIYLVLKNLGLLDKFVKRYIRMVQVMNNPEITWEKKAERVYNQVKNWWLSLEGVNFK